MHILSIKTEIDFKTKMVRDYLRIKFFFQRLLLTSDPLISTSRELSKKKSKIIPQEVKNLLIIEDCEASDTDSD